VEDFAHELAQLDPELADIELSSFLDKHPDEVATHLDSILHFTERHPLQRARAKAIATQNRLKLQEEQARQREIQICIRLLNSSDSRERQGGAREYVLQYERGNVDLLDSKMLRILDQSFAELIKAYGHSYDGYESTMVRLGLASTLQLLNNIKDGKRFRDGLEQRIADITVSIKERIGEALGLEANHTVITNGGTNGHYGAISMGMSQRVELRQTLKLKLEHLPENFLEIEAGLTIEEMKERVRTLNFLVPHEMGHLVQKSRNIPRPLISEYQQLDQEKAQHQANEVLIDKLAFETARDIYVAGEGDALFDQETREIIAIKACLTLSEIVLRNQLAGVHTIASEFFIRSFAILLQMSKNVTLSGATKKQIGKQLDALKQYFIKDKDEAEREEIKRLIIEYGEIYSKAYLAI
jgi:hypothetical protein